MADDHFSSLAPTVTGPAIKAYAVTPHDTNDLTDPIRAITINGSGTVSYISSRDNGAYTTGTLPVGTYVLFASRIRSTGTTATNITGWV